MSKMAFLEYTFFFAPSETWSHLFEFEKTFSDYLLTRGYEAEIITSSDGAPMKRVMLIKKREQPVSNPIPKLTSNTIVVKPQ